MLALQTLFVTASSSPSGDLRLYKVHTGRLGEFPPADRFAGFPAFDYAFFEAEKLPRGAGWKFLRMIPLEQVAPALLAKFRDEMQRVDHCRTRGRAPDPQATDW